jgi:hypothetical protein
VTTETLRIKVVGLRELNKVSTAVDKLDKKIKSINKSRVTGTTTALKILRQELSIKNKILKTDQQILKARNGQIKANRTNAATQVPKSGGGGVGGGGGGSGLSSALISGAFPLLFGQGPFAALGGFTGGLIGDKVGGKMGGFAGGLVGTTIATGIQTAITSIGELGQAMNALNPDITALSNSMGIMGTIEERRLQIIEQTQGKQAALNAALEMMGDKIGEENVEELRKFGEAFRSLTNSTVLFFTKVQAAVAKLLNQAVDAGEDANLRGRARGLVAQNPNNAAFQDINKEIANLEEKRSGAGRKGVKDFTDQINALKAQRLEIAETLILEKDKDKLRAKTNKLITAGLAELEKENELSRAIIAGKEEEFLIEQAVKSEVEKIGQTMETINATQLQRIRDGVTINKDLKEQAENAKKVEEAFKNIAKSVQDDIKEGIKGLIKGTSTLADLLNKVADKFLDLAIDQAFGSFGGGGIFGFLGNIFKANGGPVAGGNPYVVGEKGPELFVPKSSGTIVPNNELGGGGSTSVVVNVDASGTSAEGDEPDAAQLGRLIGSVVQAELIKESRPGGLLSSTR